MFLFYFKDIKGFSAGYGTIIGSSAFNIALIPVISFVYLYITKGKEKVFQINKSIVKQDALFLLGAITILSFILKLFHKAVIRTIVKISFSLFNN